MEEYLKSLNEEQRNEYINSLGIYELRGLARALGIKSPTTKVREKLVEEINETLLTGKISQPRDTRKGRPYKQLSHLKDILSVVTGKVQIETPSPDARFAILNQDVPIFNTSSDEVKKMCGIVSTQLPTACFIDLKSGHKVFLSEQFMNENSLKNDMYVEVEAYKINDSNCYYAQKLISCIGEKDSINLSRILPSKFNEFEDGQILLGGRNVVLTDAQMFMCPTLKNLLKSLDKQDAVNIFVGLDVCFEDRFFLFELGNFTNFITQYEGEKVSGASRIEEAMTFLSLMLSQGKSVNLIIYDVATLFSALENEKNSDNQCVVTQLRKLMSQAAAYENDQSVTVIASINIDDAQEKLFRNEIVKISTIYNENLF